MASKSKIEHTDTEYISPKGGRCKIDIAGKHIDVQLKAVPVKVLIPSLPENILDTGIAFATIEDDDVFVYTPFFTTYGADQVRYTFIHEGGETVVTVGKFNFVVKCPTYNISVQTIPCILPNKIQQKAVVASVEWKGTCWFHRAVIVDLSRYADDGVFIIQLKIPTLRPQDCSVVFPDGQKADCTSIQTCYEDACTHLTVNLYGISQACKEHLRMTLSLWNAPIREDLARNENQLKRLHKTTDEYSSKLNEVILNRNNVVHKLNIESQNLKDTASTLALGKGAGLILMAAGLVGAPFTGGASLGAAAAGAATWTGSSVFHGIIESFTAIQMNKLFQNDHKQRTSLGEWEGKFCNQLEGIMARSINELLNKIISRTQTLGRLMEDTNRTANRLLSNASNFNIIPESLEDFFKSFTTITKSHVAQKFIELAQKVKNTIDEAARLLNDLQKVIEGIDKLLKMI